MNGLRIALTCSAALIICVAPVKAEQWWVVIQKDTDGTVYLADSDFSTDDASQTKTFWTHAFYEMPKYGMKSLKVEYTVHCANRTMTERRYFEYDANDIVVFSGNNIDENTLKPVVDGSVKDRLLTFACSSSSFRQQSYAEINKNVDYRKRVVSDAVPQETIFAPADPPTIKKSVGTTDSLHLIASISRYQECVLKSARTFAEYKESATNVAKAAVSNCPITRQQIVATDTISRDRSSEERTQFIIGIDARMQSLAEREVVKLRAK